MPGGTDGWLGTAVLAPHVTHTETGYLTWGIPVSFSVVHSPDGEPPPTRYLPRILTLLEEYGAICTAAQTVFPIGSCYRSLHYQRECFHTSREEHTLARAMDLLPPEGWSARRVSVYVLERRRDYASRVTGIGIAPGWVHFEIAPIPHRALWRWPTNRKAD